MSDLTVTSADVEAVASKLEGMKAQFSAEEFETLAALFHLAGRGMQAIDPDVSGFSFSFGATNPAGILIGLNQAFQLGGVATGVKYGQGDGSVMKW